MGFKDIISSYWFIPSMFALFSVWMLIVARNTSDWGAIAYMIWFIFGVIFTIVSIPSVIFGKKKGFWWGVLTFFSGSLILIMSFIFWARFS
jgi:hypothetical protein